MRLLLTSVPGLGHLHPQPADLTIAAMRDRAVARDLQGPELPRHAFTSIAGSTVGALLHGRRVQPRLHLERPDDLVRLVDDFLEGHCIAA